VSQKYGTTLQPDPRLGHKSQKIEASLVPNTDQAGSIVVSARHQFAPYAARK
jgi:hypothetical protein